MEVIYFLAQLLFILSLFALPLALIYPRAFAPLFGGLISRLKLTLVLAGILLVSFLVAVAANPDYISQVGRQDKDGNHLHEVTSVVDGDTIRVRIDGQIEPVRLIGIDAPELDHEHGEHECYAQESTARAREVLNNQRVRLEADNSQGDQDTHGRLLRYVFLANNTNVNLQMVAGGYAVESTFDTPYSYQQEFRQAEQLAKSEERGLWSPTLATANKRQDSLALPLIIHCKTT